MAEYTAGSAYVQILPSLRGFNRTLTDQLDGAVAGAGTSAGALITKDIGESMRRRMPTALEPSKKAFDSLATSFWESGERASTRFNQAVIGGTQRLASPLTAAASRASQGATAAFQRLPEGARRAFSAVPYAAYAAGTGVVSAWDRTATGIYTSARRIGTGAVSAVRMPLLAVGGLFEAFGVNAAAGLGVAGAAAAFAGIKFNAFQESATIAFTTMLGSAQKAQAYMAELKDFAAQTPFDLQGLVRSAQQLMAFGFAARDVLPMLTTIGDAVSAMGGSTEEIQGVTRALGQMKARGKVSGEEILQLTERGIPALRILANQMGVSTAQLSEMIRKGDVLADEAIPKILDGMKNGTQGAAGVTKGFAGMMEAQAKTLTGVWSNFVDNFNRALGKLMEPAMPAIKSSLTWMTGALKQIPARLDEAKAAWGRFLSGFRGTAQGGGWLVTFGERARLVVDFLKAEFSPTFRLLGQIMDNLAQLAKPLLQALGDTLAVWGVTAGAGLKVVASLLNTVILPAIEKFTAFLAQHQGTVRLFADAVGIYLVGKLALLKMQGAIAGVKGFIGVLGTAKTAVFAIATWPAAGIRALGSAWDTVRLKAMFAADKMRAAGSAIASVSRSALTGAKNMTLLALAYVKAGIAATVSAAKQLAIATVQRTVAIATRIWAAAQAALNFVMNLNPFVLIGTLIAGLVAAIVWAYRNVDWFRNGVQACWDGIKAATLFVWRKVLKPAIDWISLAFRVCAQGVMAVWTPFWRGMQRLVSTVVGWITDWLKFNINAWTWAFRLASKILTGDWSGAWRMIQDTARRVLGWVRGIIDGGLNAVRNSFRSAVSAIGRIWDGLRKAARDPVQFVVDAVYNNGIRALWNKVSGVFGGPQLPRFRFASGGIVPGYTPGRDPYLIGASGGEAMMRPEWTRAAGADYINRANAAARSGGTSGASQFIADNGLPGYAGGGIVDRVMDWGGSVLSGIGRAAGAIGRFTMKVFTDPIGAVKGLLEPVIGKVREISQTGWGQVIGAIPGKIVGGLADKAKSLIGAMFSGGGYGASPVANIGAGVQRWTPVVLRALAMLGLPAGLLGTTLRRMNQESGGNPNAINNWDINAKRGTPSVGLMQVIGPTFSAYRDPRASGNIYDPLANILASMRYALTRYGSLPAAYNRPGGYDSGGWLPPGYSTVFNGTGKPEPVLTTRQLDALTTAASTTAGGQLTGRLFLDSGELLGVVRGEVVAAQDAAGSALNSGRRL